MLMSILNRLNHYLRDSRYCIGFVEGYEFPEKIDYNRIHWLDLNGYKDGWFADPFILEADIRTVTVLAEEWYYPLGHGRLSKLTICRNGFRLMAVKPILQLDTHLSFPYIIREDDKVYVCPENWESGNVWLYEYDIDSDSLVNPVKLVDKPLLDVQIFRANGGYCFTGIEYATGEQTDTRILRVYKSENLAGPYDFKQTITSENCDKRGAGQTFRYNDRIIRPSQCCDNNEYGTAVIFNEITFEEGALAEREIGRITRNKRKRNGFVLHTFNQLDTLIVIDGWDYQHRYIGILVESMRKTIRKIIPAGR